MEFARNPHTGKLDAIGVMILQQTTAPANPKNGTLWLDTDAVTGSTGIPGYEADGVTPTGVYYELVVIDGALATREI